MSRKNKGNGVTKSACGYAKNESNSEIEFKKWWDKNESEIGYELGGCNTIDDYCDVILKYCQNSWNYSRKIVFSEFVKMIKSHI